MRAIHGTPCSRFLHLLPLGLLLIGNIDAFAPFPQRLVGPSASSHRDLLPRECASRLTSTFPLAPSNSEGRISRLLMQKKSIAAHASASIQRDGAAMKSLPPRWMFWRRRGRFSSKGCTTSSALIIKEANDPAGLAQRRGPSSWVRRVGQAAAAVLVFVALRPLKAVAGGGGFGGSSKANMPPLERCVRWTISSSTLGIG
jgi:hypothetical protein